jgi:hypothetical protein
MKRIETEIQIAASPETVWKILTDLEQYPEWNPFIRNAQGQLKEDQKLAVRIAPPGSKEMTFKPMVTTVIEYVEFSWLGHFIFPGIFDGRHIFGITENEGGCLLVQKEEFSGLLVPLLWNSMEKNTREGFVLMNEALKQRAERADAAQIQALG